MADSKKKIQVIRLGSVHYQHTDLQKASSFLLDFGLIEAARQDGRIYYRGFGVDPYVYVAEVSPSSRRRFLGGTWVVESVEDLQLAASLPNASSIRAHNAPGGGQTVTVIDPSGFPVNFIYGQNLRQTDPSERIDCNTSEPSVVQNLALQKQRRGEFRRMQPGPSPVHKLGHYGLVVPRSRYDETLNWYLSHMTLIPTDTVYDQETGDDMTCFIHIDRGLEYSDHHSLFITVGPEDKGAHVHHSSFEINDLDTQFLGHDWLLSKGWTNCWGIGRHILGSQIFDYWFDASGNVVEHYADGDIVNSRNAPSREPGSLQSIHIWGPNAPLAFVMGDESLAGKSITAPPDVLAAKPALVSTN